MRLTVITTEKIDLEQVADLHGTILDHLDNSLDIS